MYSLEVGQQAGLLSSRLQARIVPAAFRHLKQHGQGNQLAASAPPIGAADSIAGTRSSQPRWVPIGPGRGLRLLDVSTCAHSAIPPAQGLFDPANDKDSCGVGFVGELSKNPSRKCVKDALQMLVRMSHRGACGCEANTGKNTMSWLSSLVWGRRRVLQKSSGLTCESIMTIMQAVFWVSHNALVPRLSRTRSKVVVCSAQCQHHLSQHKASYANLLSLAQHASLRVYVQAPCSSWPLHFACTHLGFSLLRLGTGLHACPVHQSPWRPYFQSIPSYLRPLNLRPRRRWCWHPRGHA